MQQIVIFVSKLHSQSKIVVGEMIKIGQTGFIFFIPAVLFIPTAGHKTQ
jgi:hypothetical protein